MYATSYYEYACPSCGDHAVDFVGDKLSAMGECPDCGDVEICPDELAASDAAEAAGDAYRDGDF